jgi:hypothetical protein
MGNAPQRTSGRSPSSGPARGSGRNCPGPICNMSDDDDPRLGKAQAGARSLAQNRNTDIEEELSHRFVKYWRTR